MEQHRLAHIISRCFVNIPCAEFDRYKALIRQYRINPELGLEGDVVYTYRRRDFQAIATFLAQEGLRCTLHAPFNDMLPGAEDKNVLQATREKLLRCFDLIEILQPCSIVCHLGYLEYVHSYNTELWLANSLETWKRLLLLAENQETPVMFENTYEADPQIHRMVLENLDSPSARFCLDVGHLLAFARTSWHEWVASLERWLGQLHLHDNHGLRDEHLPVGKGDFDFVGLFSCLKTRKIEPLITLEPRSENDLWDSLNALDRLALFEHKID
jgi:sugar phosphate isomerase/epimerase